jgi:hypothetical protein
MQFDRQKLTSAVHYVIAQCQPEDLGAVKLNKVLYYADMLRYALTGAPITGATYFKRPFGPACNAILASLHQLKDAGSIEIHEVGYFGYLKKEYVSCADPTLARLSAEERALIDEVMNFVCKHNTARTISDFSHDAAWDMVDHGEPIPYLAAFNLLPNPVDLETVEWAQAESAAIVAERSKADTVGLPPYADFRSRVLQTVGQR